MKKFWFSFITLILFIFSTGCFYAAITVSYPVAFINIALVIIAIFTLVHACGRIDKGLGLGKYANQPNNTDDESFS